MMGDVEHQASDWSLMELKRLMGSLAPFFWEAELSLVQEVLSKSGVH